jgi:hypothetical protein
MGCCAAEHWSTVYAAQREGEAKTLVGTPIQPEDVFAGGRRIGDIRHTSVGMIAERTR